MSNKQLQFYDSSEMSTAKMIYFSMGVVAGMGVIVIVQTAVYFYLKSQGILNTWLLL